MNELNARQYIEQSINREPEFYLEPNIETGKPPEFLVYCARGNNREMLNIYFDYKTSARFINRKIIQLGYYDSFTVSQIRELESLAVVNLFKIGSSGKRAKDTYQGEGVA